MAPVAKSAALKRQAQAAAVKAPVKEAKKARKEIADPNQPFIEAVEAAGDRLPDSCKAMLVAVLPCLHVPSDLRDATQTRMVGMLREVIESVKVQKQEALNVQEQAVEKAKASMDSLVAAVAEAEAATTAAAEVSASKKAEAAESEAVLLSKTESLKAACEAQKLGDAGLQTAEAEGKQFQDAIDGPLRILCSSDDWDAATATEHCKTLMALMKNLGSTDESCLMSVPACMKKAPAERGDFDKMVIDSVDKGLKDRVAELKVTLEAGEGAKAERAAAVEAAQRDVNAAESAKVEKTDALNSAMAAEQAAAGAVQAAQGAVKSFQPEVEKVQAARDAEHVVFENFLKNNVARFTELEGKESAAQQAGA